VSFKKKALKSIRAEIITIGDELLIGQVIDTNSAWIGKQLSQVGIQVHQITSVSDEIGHMLDALVNALTRADMVLVTGGLGPTKDDKTKEMLCAFFGTSLEFSPEAYLDVESYFKKRGREVSDLNRRQAEVPGGCTVLSNKVGTAPGMWFEHQGKIIVSMPGVPHEMKFLMENEVIGRLKSHFHTPFILHRTLLTHGIGESVLAEKLEEFESKLPLGFQLAYLPSPGLVKLRLSATGEEAQVRVGMEELETRLTELVKDYLFGYDDDDIQSVLGRRLKALGWTISTAESCTGGTIGHLITSVPGSSAWYAGSTITYSYESKTRLLGVPADLIQKHGAVSEEVVLSMARNVREKLGTHCAVATSGVAGPGGGTPEKPVGTVWIGVALPDRIFARKLQLGDNRLITIRVASESALHFLRKALD